MFAADTGSTDNSGELLRKELGERNVISLDGRKGYGAAVDAVLAQQKQLRAGAKVPAGSRSDVGKSDGVSLGATSAASARSEAGSVAVLSDEQPGDDGTNDDGTNGDTPTGHAPNGGTPNGDAPNGRAPHSNAPTGDAPHSHEWIWLLQDDAEPAPDALARLLEATERATTATVVGCKQLDWENHRRLLDVGLWSNKNFDRFTLVGLDEQDQGQYDTHADVFAVNTAGMLVRRDVFERMGGFDPALPGPGDDLDFCARVRLSGDRVLVVPDAHMYHVVHRPNGMGSAVAARKASIFMRLKHAPAGAVPFVTMGTFLSALYWLIAGFVLKAPGHAVRMFAASCAGLLRPIQLARSRRALKSQRKQPRSSHKGLLVDNRAARAHLKALREAVGPEEEAPRSFIEGPALLEPTGETHQQTVAPLAAVRTTPIVSALALTILLAALSLLALSRFLGAPALTGGALLPVSDQLAQVWQNATSWWVPLGSGMPGRGNPFNFVLALPAALGGNGSAAVLWLVLLALPLAGFTGWLGAGALTLRRWPRVVAGLVWAGAPALLVGMGQGRVGALLAHILIPLVMLGLIRAVGSATAPRARKTLETDTLETSNIAKLGRPGVDGNPSWTAAAAAGLGLAVVTAASPSLLPVSVVGILLTAVLMGRRGKTIWWALIPPAALFGPLIWSAWENPRAIFADPGMPLASNPGPVWAQLLGFPEHVDPAAGLTGIGALDAFPWLGWVVIIVVGAPVLIGAVLALLLPLRRAAMARVLWLVALLALAGVYASAFIAVAFDGVTLVTPFSGPAVSLAFFALLGAALLGFDAVARRAWDGSPRTTREQHRVAKATATVLSVLLVAAPLASLGLWTVQQFSGAGDKPALSGPFLTHAATTGTIPATAADRGTGPEASRTIVMNVLPDGGVHVALMQGSGTTLDAMSTIATASAVTGDPGAETLVATDRATAVLQDSVGIMVSKSGIDPRAGLVELGVGFVVLRQGDTAAELLANEIEAVPGLDTVGPTESGWLWRVKPGYSNPELSDVVNRVRLLDVDGNILAPVPSSGQGVDTRIPAADGGRTVVLAERADPGWQATLDGKALTGGTADWAQSFEVPPAGGHLEIRYVHPMSLVLGMAQLVLLGLTLLLAIPVRARRGRTGAYRDEASLQRIGRGA